jgi:uncharacterized membrane protein
MINKILNIANRAHAFIQKALLTIEHKIGFFMIGTLVAAISSIYVFGVELTLIVFCLATVFAFASLVFVFVWTMFNDAEDDDQRE